MYVPMQQQLKRAGMFVTRSFNVVGVRFFCREYVWQMLEHGGCMESVTMRYLHTVKSLGLPCFKDLLIHGHGKEALEHFKQM